MLVIKEVRIHHSFDCCGGTIEHGSEIDGFAEFALKWLEDLTAVNRMGQGFPDQQSRWNPLVRETVELGKTINQHVDD